MVEKKEKRVSDLARLGIALKGELEEDARIRAEDNGVPKYSIREQIEFLRSAQPKTKNDRLRVIFQNLCVGTTTTVGNPSLNKDIAFITDLFRTIITGSYDNPRKLKSFIPGLEALIDKKAEEYPAERK